MTQVAFLVAKKFRCVYSVQIKIIVKSVRLIIDQYSFLTHTELSLLVVFTIFAGMTL